MEHSFQRLVSQVARHQRIGAADAPVVEVGPVLSANLEDIAEARGNDQGSLGALALEEGVGRNRRPVYEEVDGVGGQGVPVHQFADSGGYSEGLVDRCGGGLANSRRSVSVS